MNRVLRALALGALATVAASAPALAAFPEKPVTVVVPFPPGGSTDPVARIIQAKMIENTGWNILVDNKPGGTGAVGSAIAAKSAPDGYTQHVTMNVPDRSAFFSEAFRVLKPGAFFAFRKGVRAPSTI